MEEASLFRAPKKRKVLKVSTLTEEDDPQVHPPRSPDEDSDPSGDAGGVAALLRARKQNKGRGSGIQFSNSANSLSDIRDESTALVPAEEYQDKLQDISDRFVGTTGQVVDVDKHMMAYIESEMAKRNQTASQVLSTQNQPPHYDTRVGGGSTDTSRSAQMKAPAGRSLGQIAEVDLGLSAHELNLARTEAAIARAQSGLPPTAEEPRPPKPRKPRIGRDGKPMRPRPRKRRNSEDLARDALVEQVLHEHKLDVYNDAEPSSKSEARDTPTESQNVDADEQLAERFRQEFMDAIAERRHRNKPAAQPKAAGAVATERGPRLGGSRSARAKMAQLRQQQQQQPGQQPTQKK